ncbi:hypothetical protein [Actinomadura nitritigenes]|uniref:Uncharacterized protein n=1 Tax=Actinomadura nitritigenes TaxID=134602 RepID=A0ABS3RA10_9ACTN|nr:hypothetical protein [Actinomadura nitritigenes]MBO2443084.1 hypothetical protein [Actinomadura nitritigenes]
MTGCGGPDFSAGDYAHILRHFALGTPSPGRSGPAALPWVTISEVRGGDDGTRIGVALEDWTGEADGAGRPIAETRYLCVPYEALRAVPVSYTGLYEALAGLTPPFPAEGVELGVAALDPAVPARALQRFGVQRVAAAASLLIDGPVTITAAPDLSAVDRLAFLDTVAALLPYGWRTRFSAATWDQSGNRNVSLAFARQVRDRTTELDWRTPRLPERDTPGRAYAEMLADLFGDRGRSHAEVIGHLAQATAPLADTDPATVVRVLGGLDWPATVLQAVERGTHDPADVRDLLATGRHRELGDAGARKILTALIREHAPEDVPLLHERWADLGQADDLLASLLGPADRGEDENAGAETAALVVLDMIDLDAVASGGPQWPATLGALAANPRAVCALMTELAFGPPDRLVAWYGMLAHRLPESLLGPFGDVLFDPLRPVAPDRLAALAGHGTGCVADLLALGSGTGRLGYVLPGLAGWLTALDRVPDEGPLKARLTQVKSPAPRERGVLDGLLLWLGAPPHHITGVTGEGHEPYWDGFRSIWTCPMPAGHADRRPETLASWARAGGWAGAAGGVDAVLMLARALSAEFPGEGRLVEGALLTARTRVRGLDRAALYRGPWGGDAADAARNSRRSRS